MQRRTPLVSVSPRSFRQIARATIRERATAFAALLLSAGAIVGCGTPTPDPAPSPSTPTPDPAPNPSLFNATFENMQVGATIDPGPYRTYIDQQGGGVNLRATVFNDPQKGKVARLVMPPALGASADVPNRVQYNPPVTARSGTEVWYSYEMKLGDDWQLEDIRADRQQFAALAGNRWGSISSRHNGPGLGTGALHSSPDGPIHLSSRETRSWPPFSDGAGPDSIVLGPVVKNRWYKFVVHIKFGTSLSQNPVREYWRDGVFMGRSTRVNLPTDSDIRVARIGLYEGTAVDHTRTIYWDNHRIGRTRAEVGG